MKKAVYPLLWTLCSVLTIGGIFGFFLVDSANQLFGVFRVDVANNIFYIVSGIFALVMGSAGYKVARGYLILFGLIFGAICLIGFAQNGNILNLMQVNMADNYLHLTLAAVMLMVGFASPTKGK